MYVEFDELAAKNLQLKSGGHGRHPAKLKAAAAS
jgi:hypothetical protein